MIDYSPSWIEWLLLTSSVPVSLVFMFAGVAMLVWLMTVYWSPANDAPILKLGLPAVALIAVAMVLPGLAPVGELNTQIKSQISSMAKLENIKLAHVETESSTLLTDGSVMFVGTGTNADKNQVQFTYTQYDKFGIYETIGFDNKNKEPKPTDSISIPPSSINLDNADFMSLQRGHKVLG